MLLASETEEPPNFWTMIATVRSCPCRVRLTRISAIAAPAPAKAGRHRYRRSSSAGAAHRRAQPHHGDERLHGPQARAGRGAPARQVRVLPPGQGVRGASIGVQAQALQQVPADAREILRQQRAVQLVAHIRVEGLLVLVEVAEVLGQRPAEVRGVLRGAQHGRVLQRRLRRHRCGGDVLLCPELGARRQDPGQRQDQHRDGGAGLQAPGDGFDRGHEGCGVGGELVRERLLLLRRLTAVRHGASPRTPGRA